MDRPTTKDDLVRRVRVGRARWDALLARFDDAAMLRPALPGGTTLKDLIAHVSWYEKEAVGVLQRRALIGSDLWNLPLDERNAILLERSRDRSLEEIRVESKTAFEMLAAELEGVEEEVLNDPSRFAEMPIEWRPWKLVAENSYEHYAAHFGRVEELLRER